nr:MAG TPA: hypothetical protein [Caudoviricetes sp.]
MKQSAGMNFVPCWLACLPILPLGAWLRSDQKQIRK